MKLAKKYQQAPVNILSQITTIAKTTPNLIDFSIGDPDLITDQEIIEASFQDVKNGQTKYTEASGDIELLEAISGFYNRTYDLQFPTSEIRATVGACHGMYLALQAIIDTGDEVIIHEPYFTPYKDQVLAAGGVPVFIPTYEKDDFAINLDILEAAITDKTKALILNSPNNPTGAVFSKEIFEEIATLAQKHDFYILSDEVYDGFSFYEKFTPMAKFAPEHTITLGSLSKNFAMTGWRIGYMIAGEYIIQAVKAINEGITFSAPSPSQRAAVHAMNNAEKFIPAVTKTFQERLEYVGKRVAEIPYLSIHPVKGTIYAFINISGSGMTSVPFCEYVLKETQVLLIPGLAFGDTGDNYVRLAATQNLEVLEEAFDRLAKLTF
ncbi:pyridoxal phosphate-dependent aminotransferase [Listeria sp. SHR_NRA_18]|uniref:pyridoxal phosphate-dependent aminotransferase n=1 Tax=Listeria sp. SHR_NRA_18 TaxID=2269046 RepID=UPI00051D03E4|nr:pyridoxal phosphate-dependent aminotransferase [Listeria sp. SHR_NRA_18]KGL45882.1 aspartate aminotransferase [Listeriaceae bacterium FSL A5-0209]RQW65564.1 pyridoxal phosphate-dependent aminotransferase [Listeria sp. SHR_NRA_18]